MVCCFIDCSTVIMLTIRPCSSRNLGRTLKLLQRNNGPRYQSCLDLVPLAWCFIRYCTLSTSEFYYSRAFAHLVSLISRFIQFWRGSGTYRDRAVYTGMGRHGNTLTDWGTWRQTEGLYGIARQWTGDLQGWTGHGRDGGHRNVSKILYIHWEV